METIETMDAMKMNVIALAKHHKKHCKESDCNVSLVLLMMTCQRAGMRFKEEELRYFS